MEERLASGAVEEVGTGELLVEGAGGGEEEQDGTAGPGAGSGAVEEVDALAEEVGTSFTI